MDNIGLEFAFEITAQIGVPLTGGAGRLGQRRIIPITGGTVQGPRLNGRVLPGGADYELVRPDGNSRLEAHYGIEAEDGTPIYIVNRGLYVAPASVTARLDAGEDVPPTDYYLRAAPVFDAPDGPHGWLSDHLFVSACRFTPDAVTIKVFLVT
jgi:Protein of unknown function (DUF3237)